MESIFLNELKNLIRQEARDEVRLQLLKQSKSNSEDLSDNNNSPIIESRVGWIKSIMLLEFLHSLLISYGFITCNFKEFQSHFFGSEIIRTKIFWQTTTVRLVILFEFLLNEKLIPLCNTPHILLLEHFNFKNCDNPKIKDSLRNSLSNAHSKDKMVKGKYIMDDIINKVKKKIEEEENNLIANK